jgi:excisionase family DNA binding protein
MYTLIPVTLRAGLEVCIHSHGMAELLTAFQPGGIVLSMENLIPINEAARILGVAIETLRRWDRNGTLKATRHGGKLKRYYTEAQLAAFQKGVGIDQP